MAEYIERGTAIAKLTALEVTDSKVTLRNAKRLLADMPVADVAPVVHGRWIEKKAPAVRIYFECSNCGAHENKHTAIKGYYCWRCGAKMDGGDNNDKSRDT